MTKHRHHSDLDRSGRTNQQEADHGCENDGGLGQHHTHLVFASGNFDFAEFPAGEKPEAPEDQECSGHDDGQLGGDLCGDEGGHHGAGDPNDLLGRGVQRKQRGELFGGHHRRIDGANGGLNRGSGQSTHETDCYVGADGH